MFNVPFGFFELSERSFLMLHHKCVALRTGRIPLETSIVVHFNDINRHPRLLETFNTMQPVDRFLVEQSNIMLIALYAGHQAFIRIKPHGVLSESRDLSGFFDRMHVASSSEKKV